MTKVVTATQASRGFAGLLNEIDQTGEVVQIERQGRPIALVVPYPRTALTNEAPSETPPARQGEGSMSRRVFPAVEHVLRPAPEREALLRNLLGRLEDEGCELRPPGGDHRMDYVNVYAPGIRGRVVSVNASTGRSEFQNDSWDYVGGSSPRFERLDAGNKAAHPLKADADIDKIMESTRAEIRRRR